jgi:hypothetical protein
MEKCRKDCGNKKYFSIRPADEFFPFLFLFIKKDARVFRSLCETRREGTDRETQGTEQSNVCTCMLLEREIVQWGSEKTWCIETQKKVEKKINDRTLSFDVHV